MPRRPSSTALDLSRALEREGEPTSPRQLERMRQAGLLARVRQRGRGQPEGGSTVDYGADVRERAHDAIRLHGEWRNAQLAVLAMFGEGRFRVEKPELEGAFARSLSGLRRRLLERSRATQPIDAALKIASGRAERASRAPNHKEIRARLKRTRRSRSDSLHRLLLDLYFEAVMICSAVAQPRRTV